MVGFSRSVNKGYRVSKDIEELEPRIQPLRNDNVSSVT